MLLHSDGELEWRMRGWYLVIREHARMGIVMDTPTSAKISAARYVARKCCGIYALTYNFDFVFVSGTVDICCVSEKVLRRYSLHYHAALCWT